MKTRLLFKFILMLIIPYICACLIYAGLFLTLIYHINSLARLIICTLIFTLSMFCIRYILTYPINNLISWWRIGENKLDKTTSPLVSIINLFIDFGFGIITIILVKTYIPHQIIINHFIGFWFMILFASLLIGNALKPDLAIFKDSGSNN